METRAVSCFTASSHGRDPGLIGIHPYCRKAIYPVPCSPFLSLNQKEGNITAELLCITPKPKAGEEEELQMGYRCDMKLIQQWTDVKAPLKLMQLEVKVEPVVAMVCASHIVQDKTSGIMYLEMVITSVG